MLASPSQSRGGRSRRASGTKRARLAAIATRSWRLALAPPEDALSLPVPGRENPGRSRRASCTDRARSPRSRRAAGGSHLRREKPLSASRGRGGRSRRASGTGGSACLAAIATHSLRHALVPPGVGPLPARTGGNIASRERHPPCSSRRNLEAQLVACSRAARCGPPLAKAVEGGRVARAARPCSSRCDRYALLASHTCAARCLSRCDRYALLASHTCAARCWPPLAGPGREVATRERHGRARFLSLESILYLVKPLVFCYSSRINVARHCRSKMSPNRNWKLVMTNFFHFSCHSSFQRTGLSRDRSAGPVSRHAPGRLIQVHPESNVPGLWQDGDRLALTCATRRRRFDGHGQVSPSGPRRACRARLSLKLALAR